MDGKHSCSKSKSNYCVFVKSFFEWIDAVIVALVIVVVVFTFLFRVVVVSGQSMMDTLHDGDRVCLTNFMYEPHDGDIVVVTHAGELNEPIIKRVIAVEGQSLKIDFAEGKIYVDNNYVDEYYISSPIIKGDSEIPEIIPSGCVFVMGDNRSNSLDSRFKKIGLVKKENILGKAECIVFPLDRIGRA